MAAPLRGCLGLISLLAARKTTDPTQSLFAEISYQ
jgi:hypothetical protein